MRIRQATLKDSMGIARVQVDSYQTAYAGILPQAYLDHFTYNEQEQDWRDLFAGALDDLVFVAETDSEEIVGYALGRAGPTDVSLYDSELVALHVRRSHQRQGTGQRLLVEVAGHLRQRGSVSLMLWVLAKNQARTFYERLGGQLIGERSIHLDEDVCAVEVAYGWPSIERLCAAHI